MPTLDLLTGLLDKVEGILQGEPARAIGYGGAAIIYLVAKAVGAIPDQTPEQALVEAGSAIAVVASFVESIRHFVYSPATVQAIVEEGDTT